MPTGLLPMISRDFGRTTWDNFRTRRECVECVVSCGLGFTERESAERSVGVAGHAAEFDCSISAREYSIEHGREINATLFARVKCCRCPKRMRRPERVWNTPRRDAWSLSARDRPGLQQIPPQCPSFAPVSGRDD